MSVRSRTTRPGWRAGFVVATLLVVTSAGAQDAFVGLVRGRGPVPDCTTPLGPGEAELFAFADPGSSPDNVQWHVNGSRSASALSWDGRTGAWLVNGGNFPEGSLGGDALVVVVTHVPAGDAPGAHHGFVSIDASTSPSFSFGDQLVRAVPAPSIAIQAGGNELAWPSLTEPSFDAPCALSRPHARPRIVGYDVYRLDVTQVPAPVSTAQPYLCGPDLDCATSADNGFIARVADAPGPDGLVRWLDAGAAGNPMRYSYAIQPVVWGAPSGDADGDGITDHDVDADGIPEFVDPQGTARGLTARVEISPGVFVKRILISTDAIADASDSDGDGVADTSDNCPSTRNPTQGDRDGDGTGDACEDADGDGLTDELELATGTDPDDADSDDDAVGDGVDDCPLAPNAGQADRDADGVGDACDDGDADGLTDEEELAVGTDPERSDTDFDGDLDGADNCPLAANPAQEDGNSDGVGDACQDRDADGLLDAAEGVLGTSPDDPDTDDDTVLDGADSCPLTPDPTLADRDADGTGDACDDGDADGLTDAAEAMVGTNPDVPDTDADGSLDGADNCPTQANATQRDRDGDGVGDACDDGDGDGLTDERELALGTDPDRPDTDGDGPRDGADNCPLVANPSQEDADADGVGDACEGCTVTTSVTGLRAVRTAVGWRLTWQRPFDACLSAFAVLESTDGVPPPAFPGGWSNVTADDSDGSPRNEEHSAPLPAGGLVLAQVVGADASGGLGPR